MGKLSCHAERSISSPSWSSAESHISLPYGFWQPAKVTCPISQSLSGAITECSNGKLPGIHAMVSVLHYQKNTLCLQNPEDEPQLARALPAEGKAAAKPVLQSPLDISWSRRMVASVVALQTLFLLSWVWDSFFLLEEDVPLSIAADNILGKMKGKR